MRNAMLGGLVLVMPVLTTGRETINGAGRDIQSAGEAKEDAAR